MANLIKRATLAFGRWTGIYRKPAEFSDLAVIDPMGEPLAEPAGEMSDPTAADLGLEPIAATSTTDQMVTADGSAATDFLPLDGRLDGPIISLETAFPPQGEMTAVAAGQLDSDPERALFAPETLPIVAPTATTTTTVDAPVAAPAVVEEVKPPVEMKPIPQPRPSVSFTQLYELISTEVNKRTDNAVTVYERLLTATREELDATRKSNRIAWSIGGVMTAVAAFGAIWAAGEVSATRVEVAGLKQQVTVGQQASAERDSLRADLLKTREASAKIEVDALKSRLDQALAVSTDRDRLRSELDTVRKAKQEIEGELKLARAATTQPVSQAQPAAGRVVTAAADKASGAERPDVWSVLLNGNGDR